MLLNHIIIGAGRSGTTSMVAYLKQHHQIKFSSIKEVTYFSVQDHFNRGPEFLHSFFKTTDGGVITTSDTYLLMDKLAPKRLYDYNPDIKIAVILREPAARTHSNYNFSVNHGYINESLSLIESQKNEAEVLANADIIKQNNHCNFYGSLYHLHISNWLAHFKSNQIFVCTSNQLKDNPKELMDNYFNFLGLDKIEVEGLDSQNKAAGVKNKTLNKFLVNRNHPVRKLIRKPLQISFLRNFILNSNVVDKIKSRNKEELVYQDLTSQEKQFCNDYFKEDLVKLKEDFGIEFN